MSRENFITSPKSTQRHLNLQPVKIEARASDHSAESHNCQLTNSVDRPGSTKNSHEFETSHRHQEPSNHKNRSPDKHKIDW